VLIATEGRAASNAKARRELGWEPRYPSWRQGFPAVYGTPSREVTPVATTHPHPTG
jgi:nucleoside-diphosphate-sugar epimerase